MVGGGGASSYVATPTYIPASAPVYQTVGYPAYPSYPAYSSYPTYPTVVNSPIVSPTPVLTSTPVVSAPAVVPPLVSYQTYLNYALPPYSVNPYAYLPSPYSFPYYNYLN